MRPRAINRRLQGDLGELSAMEWLARRGACVFAPIGHSPDVDLIALTGSEARRIQVKTTTFRTATPRGESRWAVCLATSGGNRSWSGVVKRFDPATVDDVFVLAGDGRRWFIPTADIAARTEIRLGGKRYSEYEIEPTEPIEELIYGLDARPLHSPAFGGAPELESRAGL